MTGNLLRKLIYSQRHIAISATSTLRAAPLDLRDLKTFLHLAESRHFGRSARAMHVSPSTLSRQIQRLEDDLGQPLFVRDNRTVTLTEAGEELRVSPSKRCCSINSCATPSISKDRRSLANYISSAR